MVSRQLSEFFAPGAKVILCTMMAAYYVVVPIQRYPNAEISCWATLYRVFVTQNQFQLNVNSRTSDQISMQLPNRVHH